ncbi:MAG TPA: T9SS type A sorting domain-containing protein [Sunxiuqinia sp.]|nr:T9SS type A sorting domain-containing protein [Sunxiuqinia sp.]
MIVKDKLKFLFRILFLLFLNTGFLSAQTIIIDLSKTHQIIRGFGGMNHTTWIGDLNADNREKAFGNEPGEIGLSILRIHLDPNPNQFSREVPTAKLAIQKGAIVFATPWNAPNILLDPNSSQSRVDPTKYGQYVDHLNAFNTYMADNGAPLFAISVQNEPDYGEWTRWTSAEMVDFLGNYGQNIQNTVIAPESFQFRRSFTDPILNDARAVVNLDIVGGHIYGGGLYDYPLARQKGKEVWMTEHLLGSDQNETNDWNLAMTFGKEISDCMKANFSAYVYWYIRRFYGLISDDGNITDKGYVISQFSKFARPGAVRVDVDDSSASMVDITAFKTDTSLVMVVINRNSHNIKLNFNLKNGSVETLTQFTSSASKKIVNKGEKMVTNDSFSATVDAFSVATFTTDPASGGRFGNDTPVASAGLDREVTDSLGTNNVRVTLNGAGSSDQDGEIINYSWSENGRQVAWESNPQLNLSVGNHTFVLTVTDNDGATNKDTINVLVSSTNTGNVWLEAECTSVGSNWDIHSDSNCSNGQYLMVKPGVQATGSPSSNSADHLVYNFSVPENGSYKIWGRVLAPTPDDDSFWIRVDGGNWVNWNGIPGGKAWVWDDVHNQSNDNPMDYTLDAGDHTLTVCYREDGTGIDKFYVTNTGLQPSGLGEDATNCVTNTSSADVQQLVETVNVFPNPVHSTLHVESAQSFNSLAIYNFNGIRVWHKNYSTAVSSDQIQLNADNGIYLLRVSDDKSSKITKIVVDK